jgi:hypothetical protein
VLPFYFNLDHILSAASHRSRNRLPVVTFRDTRTGAVMTRSSQPMVGLTQKKCDEDELLLNLYRSKGKFGLG